MHHLVHQPTLPDIKALQGCLRVYRLHLTLRGHQETYHALRPTDQIKSAQPYRQHVQALRLLL